MGQLEKYGLYVLCLVIFLILGVTIWGGGDLPQSNRRTGSAPSVELHTPAVGGGTKAPGGTSPNNLLSGINDLIKSPVKKTETKADPIGAVVNADANKGDAPVAKDSTGGPGTGGDQTVTPGTPGQRATHTVASGETFEGIAKTLFGSAALRTEIARLNPGVEPTRLRIGQKLQLPTKAEADSFLGTATAAIKGGTTKSPAVTPVATPAVTPVVTPLAGKTTYVVVKGDTLEGIASRQLGSRNRVEDLRQANPGVDPARLKIGQKLQLPKK